VPTELAAKGTKVATNLAPAPTVAAAVVVVVPVLKVLMRQGVDTLVMAAMVEMVYLIQ
jgi:hypothetical protein